jgi:phage tail-like protein
MATTTATRKRTAKMVGPDAPRALGSLQVLQPGAPEVVVPGDDEHLSVPAMAMKVKAKAKASVSASAKISVGKNGIKASAKISIKASASLSLEAGGGGAVSHSTPRSGDPDVAYAFFSELSGLSWKAEPVPIREGGNNEYSLNMVGPGKFEPLVLKRGWFASTGEFYDMLKGALTGSKTERVNMTIAVLDRKYQKIGEYTFTRAFIIEYSGPSLNSMSGQVGFEQIRMAYDKFEYKAG